MVNIIKTFQILPKFSPQKTYYQISLKIYENARNLTKLKVKLFTKSGHTACNGPVVRAVFNFRGQVDPLTSKVRAGMSL